MRSHFVVTTMFAMVALGMEAGGVRAQTQPAPQPATPSAASPSPVMPGQVMPGQVMPGQVMPGQVMPGQVMVENAWARATGPAAKTGAVYLTIVDHGPPDRVIAFATPVAEMAELHETTMQGNVMKMRPVDGLAVTDKGPVTLAPGGYHVMLMGLKGPLRKGQTFPLSVSFQKAGTVQIIVAVEGVGAGGPAQSGGPGHEMDMHMDMGKPMTPQSK